MREAFLCRMKGKGQYVDLYILLPTCTVREQGFEGNPVNIYYTYDGRGLVPGHVEHGKFTIVCNGGEYDIAFTAIIEKPFVMTRYGKVQSLEDFKKLTYRDAAEAVKLFRSRDFFEILKYEDTRIKALYNNMRKWELDQARP